MKIKKGQFLSAIIGIFAFVLMLLAVLPGVFFKTKNTVKAYSTSSGLTQTENATVIDELWNDGFDSENMTTLMNLLWPMIKSGVSTPITAENIRTNNSSKDIVIKLGGLYWTITYISKSKLGDITATLWLADSSQLSNKSVYSNTSNPATKQTFGSSGTATWSSGWNSSTTSPYPSNMYGTSFMRAVVLNNGGAYATNNTTLSAEYEQKTDSVFSAFTVGSTPNDLAYYITTPSMMEWQENGESAKTDAGYSYNLPNDNWGVVVNTGFYSSTYNYSNINSNTNNSAWKDDKLWLPSLSETGYSGTTTNGGKWKLSNAQRSNATYSWLRSGGGGSAGMHIIS